MPVIVLFAALPNVLCGSSGLFIGKSVCLWAVGKVFCWLPVRRAGTFLRAAPCPPEYPCWKAPRRWPCGRGWRTAACVNWVRCRPVRPRNRLLWPFFRCGSRLPVCVFWLRIPPHVCYWIERSSGGWPCTAESCFRLLYGMLFWKAPCWPELCCVFLINRAFSAKRQAVWFGTQSVSNGKCSKPEGKRTWPSATNRAWLHVHGRWWPVFRLRSGRELRRCRLSGHRLP